MQQKVFLCTRSSKRAKQLFFGLIVAGLSIPSLRLQAEDPQVQEVRIDNNFVPPPIPAGSDASGGTAGFMGGASGELCDAILLANERLRQENEILTQQVAADRKRIASALATVKLKFNGVDTVLQLIDGDEFEVPHVKFLEAERDGVLTWTPLDDLRAPADAAPAPATGGIGSAGAAQGMAERATANGPDKKASEPAAPQNPKPPVPTPPVERRIIIKDQDITIESLSPKGNRRFRLEEGGVSEADLPGGTLGPKRYQVKQTGLQHLTYQQPTAPWQLIYEQEGSTLRQWVKFSNFTPYKWSKDTKVTLSDLFSNKENRILELSTKAEIPGRSSVIQLLKEFPIKEESFSFALQNQNSLTTKTLVLDFTGYMPNGEYRDTVQPGFAGRTAKITEKAGTDNVVRLDNEPSLLAIKKLWDVEGEGTVIDLTGGNFSIAIKRKTVFLLRNSGGPCKVKLSKAIASDWDLESTDWAEGDENYTKSIMLNGSEQIIELVEKTVKVYNFDKAEEKKILQGVVASWTGTPQRLDAVLETSIVLDSQLAGAKSKISALKQEITDLTNLYEAQEVGQDLIRDAEIRLALRGMWERLNSLKSEFARLNDAEQGLKIKLSASLYPASSY